MPVELPTFEDGYGFSCCVCGVIEAANVALKRRRAQTIKYDTPQGDIFLRAWIDTDTKDTLRVDWAKAASFTNEPPPKVTTQETEDVSRIIESAYDMTLRATMCASFRVPAAELPERGLIRVLLVDTKGPRVSVQMTGASLALTGLPISRMRWSIVNPKDDAKVVSIDVKGLNRFRVSDTYLIDVWRWIYEQFAVLVLGRGTISTDSPRQ